ncbi:MAG: transcription antitermination factor NusB [Pseudomonadota bacterium]
MSAEPLENAESARTPPAHPKSAARLAAVQALYQLEATGAGVDTVVLEFQSHRLGGDLDGVAIVDADGDYFEALVRGVVDGQDRIDRFLAARLSANWRLERVNATSRAILRAGVHELTAMPETPFRVVIDEYLEVAHAFLDDDEARFINAILDGAARAARPDEVDAR